MPPNLDWKASLPPHGHRRATRLLPQDLLCTTAMSPNPYLDCRQEFEDNKPMILELPHGSP